MEPLLCGSLSASLRDGEVSHCSYWQEMNTQVFNLQLRRNEINCGVE